ncbi:MAG: aminotransferase class V-fold PLP-dependent enzyme [Planctomycetaceae bacterium]|nr:aminotransferase class V-fold PLP-dependent enzyme [Planctomycetaceae bacterium]
MPEPPIYLDHNSTTPIDPRVVEAMHRAWRDGGANPASQHGPGRAARRMLEEAREGIAELLGAKTGGMDADRVIFTSGGTEANNLAIFGLHGGVPLVSAIEHPSVMEAARRLKRSPLRVADDPGLELTQAMAKGVPGAAEEFVSRHELRVANVMRHLTGDERRAKELANEVFVIALKERNRYYPNWLFRIANRVAAAALGFHQPSDNTIPVGRDGILRYGAIVLGQWHPVSVQLANNETGVIQPVAEIATLCHQRSITVHTDAVQAVGKIPVSFGELGVGAMTVAPHKFHGPLGIGALVLKHDIKLQPQLFGGFQQEGLRPGTENVALAIGFHEALKLAVIELPERAARMQNLRDELERLILAELPDTIVIGRGSPRLPNTSCISFPGVDRQALVMALDMAGVACSTGSACASGSSEPSPTLVAMGLPKEVIAGAIRLSLGAFTTAQEIAEAARRIIKAVKHLRSRNSG